MAVLLPSVTCVLAASALAAPASALRVYTSTAAATISSSQTLTVKAIATAATSAQATVSGFSATRQATSSASDTETARGSATVTVRAGGSGSSEAAARRAAAATARARAASRSATAARDLAHDRAYARAYAIAYGRALAAATTSATALARAAAQASATAALPTCSSPLIAKSGGGYWQCTFDDEFSGTTLDTSKWVPVTTADAYVDGGGACFVNSPDNISVSGGYLDLTVRKLPSPITCQRQGSPFTTQYTAGDVSTASKFSQTYGRFAVRASFPASSVAGLQSALWLWPNDAAHYGATWPVNGEIDIAEEYSQYSDRAIPFLHYNFDASTSNFRTNTNVVTNNDCFIADVHAFHEYAVEWTPTTFTIEYDGVTCLIDRYSSLLGGSEPFDQPFFIALTQALGLGTNALDPATTPLPATTRVDWVRVWK